MFTNEEIQLLNSIGGNIKELRLKKNYSQHDLAIEAEIPKNQIGRIERSDINTTILTLQKIAKALDVELIELMKHPI
ncbi:helix-turn-helix domain-containing protein [Leeuwenhoekiella marinoflava]|uniref:helix-turn-helix domain-containing protein n=1 Tax=Leeuwenhoekiella marinoflava TaxID=988 RepID=UPI0009F86F57|nr:helix-turn-helix transcriptional regulator [Leeuwenhoekiella marinoflava]